MTLATAENEVDSSRLHALHCEGRVRELRRELAQLAGVNSPSAACVARLYAMLLLQWGKANDAIDLLQTETAQGRGDALLLNDLGTLLYQQQLVCAAENVFQQALALDATLEVAQENLRCTSTLRQAASKLLESAGEARARWNLQAAIELAVQALGIAPDLVVASVQRNGAMIELGDYALADRLCATEHDARDFSVILRDIVAGALTLDAFPRQRRVLEGVDRRAAERNVRPTGLEQLRLGLEAAADENYPAAIAWLCAWCETGQNGHRVVLNLSPNQQFILRSLEGEQDVSGRIGLLLELALRVAQRPVALGAAVTCLRMLRLHGRARDAQRIEQFLIAENPNCKVFLEATRFVDLPALKECGLAPRRRTLILIGTCIAEGVRYALNLSPAFRARYRLRHFITNRAAPSMSEFVIPNEVLYDSAVVAHVAPQWADWGNEQAYLELLARIPAHVERISFPYPAFQPLWPFHCRDSRQGQTLPEALWRPHEDRPYYPYGDSYVLGLLRRAADPGEVVRRYLALDLARETDLDGLLAKTLFIYREREAFTDVKIADYIAENFRVRRLFDSINHITNEVALRIANQILARLHIEAVPEARLQQLAEILSPAVPIHPSVRRHFGLKYVNDDTRYAVDLYRRLTYPEYLADYVRFV